MQHFKTKLLKNAKSLFAPKIRRLIEPLSTENLCIFIYVFQLFHSNFQGLKCTAQTCVKFLNSRHTVPTTPILVLNDKAKNKILRTKNNTTSNNFIHR